MGEASSDPQLHVARLAVHLSSDLAQRMEDETDQPVCGGEDVQQALKPIQGLVADGKGAEAMPLAVQTLSVVAKRRVEATLRFHPVIPLTAACIGKDAAGRCAWIARESLQQCLRDGNAIGQAYAQLLAGYAYIELTELSLG
eukprot:g8149.t1